MRSAKRLATIAWIAASLLPLTGCWPLAPIVAIAAAAGGGGGGGGGGGPTGLSIAGTVITDGTVFDTSLQVESEPNDTLGFMQPIDESTTTQPRRIAGATSARATLHALVAGTDGVSVLRNDLWTAESVRFPASSPSTVRHTIARRGNELVFLDVDAADGRAAIRFTPLVTAFVKRRVELGISVQPAGASLFLDALVVLDVSTSSSRLVAFDLDEGRPLVITDLQRRGLAHLAGAEELLTGRPRLFTCAPKSGELFEIDVAANGRDHRLGSLVARGALVGLAGGIAALAYDGALLHVVDGAGTLHSIESDSLREVAARPLLAAGERALGLVADLDLGLDGFHVELPAGTTLSVELAVNGRTRASGPPAEPQLFLSAIESSTVAAADLTAPAWHARATSSSDRLRLTLAAPADAPKGFDLVVGPLQMAGGRYQLAFGGAARTPRDDDSNGRDVAVAESDVGRWLDTEMLGRITGDRLTRLFRDPLLADFVPNEIVLGREDSAATLALPPAPKGIVLRRLSRSPSGFDIVSLATTPEFAGPLPRTLHDATTRRSERREQSRVLLAALDGLSGAPGVTWREPNYLAQSLAVPNDPGFAANQSWHYNLLNLQAAWDITTGAATTVLAVVDSGVRTDNVDLNANVGTNGYDFVTGSNNGDGGGIDPNPFDPGTFAGNAHHGSHVGGTMGARGDNGTQGTGICWTCELMPVRGIGTDSFGLTTDIAEAIRYAARLSNASGALPSQRAAVINLSLGLASPSQVILDAMRAAINAGCIVMCASGNSGNGIPVLYPARYPEAIAVAAADPNGDVALYSNTGPEIDITCSGGAASINPLDDVWSTVVVSGVGQLQPLAGTSMACAHASGIAGLMVTMNSAIDQNDARDILRATAVDIEAPGFDDFSGFGLVDAAAALNNTSPTLDLSATNVDFGNTGADLVVQARNSGGGTLNVNTPFALTATYTPASAPGPTTAWLTATLLADGKTIHLDADRSGLAAGDYEIRVDVTSDGGNGSFTVGITVGAGGVVDIGPVEVWVFDADALTFLGGTTAFAANNYAWSISNLPAGLGPRQYFLVAGVDLDGDLVIGEPGEPFGAYPDGANAQLLELETLNGVRVDILVQ